MTDSAVEKVQTAPSVVMANNNDLQSKAIEQVPSSLPVALPNYPNLPPTGGSGVETILAVATLITALTPLIMKLLEMWDEPNQK